LVSSAAMRTPCDIAFARQSRSTSYQTLAAQYTTPCQNIGHGTLDRGVLCYQCFVENASSLLDYDGISGEFHGHYLSLMMIPDQFH
jgi:hypothetical protein